MLWVPRIGQKIPHPRITLPCFIFLGDRKKSNPNTSKTPQTKQRFINIHEPPDPAYINNNKNIKNHITKTKPVSHELLSLFVLLPVATPGPPFVKDGLMVTVDILRRSCQAWMNPAHVPTNRSFFKSSSPGVSHESYTASYINIQKWTG